MPCLCYTHWEWPLATNNPSCQSFLSLTDSPAVWALVMNFEMWLCCKAGLEHTQSKSQPMAGGDDSRSWPCREAKALMPNMQQLVGWWHTHMCLTGFGKVLKKGGLVILGGDMLNSVNIHRNRHAKLWWACWTVWRLALSWRINAPDKIHWPMELSRGIVQDGLGDQCKSASAVTPVLLQTLGKPCGQHCPWGRGSPAAGNPWIWVAACRMFPALPAALQWKHSLVGAASWAREYRAWLERSGKLGYGFFSLEAARLGKLHEVSIADTQKAAQDALQVSKSFLASRCYTRVLFCVNHVALYRCVVYPRASQMVVDAFA